MYFVKPKEVYFRPFGANRVRTEYFVYYIFITIKRFPKEPY